MIRIGIDSGGTFTDFVVDRGNGCIETFKLRSNPANPASVIQEGLSKIGAVASSEVIHGSTVATNALLERKGAPMAFITTEGFEDILLIGRQHRPYLYDLTPPPRRLLLPRERTLGVRERIYFDGEIGTPLEGVAQLQKRLAKLNVRSVAICLLHSYQNPIHEKQLAEALAGEYIVSCSHEVCPEFREFERASTTAVNAYVGPMMDAYLSQLAESVPAKLSIMQSNGGLIGAADAGRHAVRTILSGPAGGVMGALHMARLAGFERILGFDMGGTSTDVSLVDGVPVETTEAEVDGFPVRIPMLDIHTVGAGGGSIARVDSGGLLRVGPESAGADPGPACYGLGGLATVTDAHVYLGHIKPDAFLNGQMRIFPERAEAVVRGIAKQLKITAGEAAQGILRVANSNMERAIRAVSIERGHDPRRFALVAFGGGGGLHACHLAEALGMRTVIVPAFAGVLSALGMLAADQVRDYSAGVLGRSMREVEQRFRELEKRAKAEMKGGVLSRSVDLRYQGQSYELNVPWGGDFHQSHEKVYGYKSQSREVEQVTIRVRSKLGTKPLTGFPKAPKASGHGPKLLPEYGSTTLILKGWNYRRDGCGNLIIERVRRRPAAPRA